MNSRIVATPALNAILRKFRDRNMQQDLRDDTADSIMSRVRAPFSPFPCAACGGRAA
jgi:hypothetical protein